MENLLNLDYFLTKVNFNLFSFMTDEKLKQRVTLDRLTSLGSQVWVVPPLTCSPACCSCGRGTAGPCHVELAQDGAQAKGMASIVSSAFYQSQQGTEWDFL